VGQQQQPRAFRPRRCSDMNTSFFTPQRLMKIGVALIFDFVKFLFSILFLLAPLIACVASAAAVASYFGAESLVQSLACGAGGLLVGAFEWFTGGAGAVAFQAIGEVFADALDFAAWVLFYLWFKFSGTKFSGGKYGNSKLIAAATSAIVGFVPVLNVFPTITIGVWVVEWNQWKEDQAAANDNQKLTGAQVVAAQQAALAAVYEQEEQRAMAEEYAAQIQDAA
jgi:hypothetical protein